MRRTCSRVAAAGVAAATLALALTGCEPAPQPWSAELVTVNATGTDGGNGVSRPLQLSADGTKLVFESQASDLGPTDTNGVLDVYLKDLVTGDVGLVSHNAAGTDSANDASSGARISADGSTVVFESRATDLGPADAGADYDVYAYDVATAEITLVSVNAAGTDGGNAEAGGFDVSADGSRVVFTTDANDLGPTDDPKVFGGSNAEADVYVRDLAAGTTELVSVNMAGTSSSNASASSPSISPDGTKVTFGSMSTDLVPGDTNFFTSDVFLRDLGAGTTTLLSGSGITTAPRAHGPAPFSPDGTKAAFRVFNGVPSGLYLYDVATGVSSLAVRSPSGGPPDDAPGDPVFSPDGTRLAYVTSASNLGPTDTNMAADVYVTDLATGVNHIVSGVSGQDDAGGFVSGLPSSGYPSFSADGNRVAFMSPRGNLGPRDTARTGMFANQDDVYVRDLVTKATTLVSTDVAGNDSGGGHSPLYAPDGRVVYATTFARSAPDSGTDGDIYGAEPYGADVTLAFGAEAAGTTVTYTLEVGNRGPDTAEDAVAVVVLPAAVTLQALDPSAGTCAATGDPGAHRCDLGDLVADGAVTVTATTEVTGSPGDPLTALASVASSTVDPAAHANSATATP